MTAERREIASPGQAGGPENPARVCQPTADLRPDPAAERLTVPAPAGPVPAPAVTLGRYQVRRPLGAGGFGAVYLGHDTQLDRPVAIKVLRAGPGQLPAAHERALREARGLARLRHPGIVAVHDFGTHEGRVYIVSDYLDGPALDRWLRDNRPTWPEAARIAAAVADALAHAHSRNIVHRDVKPGNILLTAGGEPVLVDFGLALDESHAGGGLKGVVSGTPWYMSPEQLTGSVHRIDGRTDVYSLGVVLYEMLTGRLPFRAAEFRELSRQVRDDEPQPPRQVVPDVPPWLERACLKALAKRQHDRYPTAGAFAEDLRGILHAPGVPTLRTGTGPGEQAPVQVSTAGPRPEQPPQPLLTSRRGARGAERRQVTVLVCGCGLFASEAYRGLDAGARAGVLRAFQQACGEAVHRWDGTLVQCNEQGLLVCFGYPVAYEDGARRAARTGLGLIEALKGLGERLLRQYRVELDPWVGLHTGLAVVEAKEDAVSLVGEARDVAVRLEDAAAPGQVLCSEATHRLIRGQFRCAGLGSRKLEGVAQAVGLFQVQGVGEARNAIEAAGRAELTPLTGRDHEISLLKERWEQAREGMGQVVLLIGEPGLGKSRLVHTLKEHVLGQRAEGETDAPVIEWRCAPHYQNTGLYPAIDFYERALGFGREESPRARFDRLVHHLGRYGLARPETVPLWAALLSLPAADRFPPLSLSPTRQREETFRLLLEWLHMRAARGPILFVVEDLHWVDASTLEFLGQFLAEGLHDSILTVLTFRPEFRTPWPALGHQTSLALTRLTRRQVGELMRRKVGDGLPEAVVEQVYDRAGGVPLFVEEFTKVVQESGVLDQAATGGTLAAPLAAREIPATLQDLVMARVDRMEGEREVAQLAAVLGREFSFELLAAVALLSADDPSADTQAVVKDEPTLQAELARLVQAEILYPKGRPPRCVYVFKHALLEDALYNALVQGRRQDFHRRIAGVLEARFPETAQTRPEVLAHHFTEGGLAEKGVGYWLKAGLRSRERSADREAIGHLTRGLAVLGTLDQTRTRDDQELQLLTALGPAYIAARGYAAPEVGPVLLRAHELCQRIGDRQQLFGVMLGTWEWRLVRGGLRPCVDLAAEGMALAERWNDPGMLMEALFMPGVTLFYRGQFADSRACHEKAVQAYDDRERTKFWTACTGHNAGVTHRCYLALTLWHLGYPDQARRVENEMRELARTIGHPFSLGHALDFTAFLAHYCRFGAEVRAAAAEEVAIATEQGFQLWHVLGTLHEAAGILLEGRPAEALPLLLKGYSAFRATGAEVRAPCYLAMLGEACTQCRRFEEAHRALDEGLAMAEKNDDRFHEAEVHRLQGELLLAESPDRTAGAEDWFRRAVEIARRQGSRAWELRATMSLARLRQRQGRRGEARAALAAVFDTYTEGFTTPDLVDARALLDGLA